MPPKAFISYSWTTPEHQEFVRDADRLIHDGVQVIFDQYDLKEGHDVVVFMEKLATDQTITHDLAFSDKAYAEKADARKAGVGTECQIISREVYDKVDQSRFIPLVCQFDESDKLCLPTFFNSRRWINFSTPEHVNENREQLIRLLFGKPALQKPTLGKPPAYLDESNAAPANPGPVKFSSVELAI